MPSNKDRAQPWEPKRVSNFGLTVEYTQAEDGTWRYRLNDETGLTLQDRAGYSNASTVSQAVNTWMRDHYEPAQRKARTQPKLPALGPGTSALYEMMNARANDNEEQAIRLREQADRLEVEAKRFRAAADVLGEDYG